MAQEQLSSRMHEPVRKIRVYGCWSRGACLLLLAVLAEMIVASLTSILLPSSTERSAVSSSPPRIALNEPGWDDLADGVISSNVPPLTRLLDCGDTTDLEVHNGGKWAPESDCNTPCPGDPAHLCGSGDRLTTYFWNGVVNDWKRPDVTGRYEVRQNLQHLVSACAQRSDDHVSIVSQ